MSANIPDLFPADCLLYNSAGLTDFAIRLKTWSPAAHIEIYTGEGYSVASRNGIGVAKYSLRIDGLIAVLRPKTGAVNMADAMQWFYSKANGQKYDWKGLLCFTLAVKQGAPDKMFCSEFAKRFYEAGGFYPLSRDWDADRTAPGNFLMSPNLEWVLRPKGY